MTLCTKPEVITVSQPIAAILLYRAGPSHGHGQHLCIETLMKFGFVTFDYVHRGETERHVHHKTSDGDDDDVV